MQTQKTITHFQALKKKGEKIACLTAYDWLLASILDKTGIDLVLVGDSGAMVFAGQETTIPMTLEQMIYHTQCVVRGVTQAMVVSDMPFLTYQISPQVAIENAGRLMKEGGTQAVKVEGGEAMAETIHKMVQIGIPVMGHVGLTPQSVRTFGGYKTRGKTDVEAEKIKQDAQIVQEAGAFSIVLEKIPAQLAAEITKDLTIPTIGIGAGPHCDGQILVTHDLLGLLPEFKPKFVRTYESLSDKIQAALVHYVQDVKGSNFPSEDESY